MRHLKLTVIVVILITFKVSAQENHIIAGLADSSMTYYNIEPDTILPYGGYPGSYYEYDIDLNFDNVVDYTIYNHGGEGLGGGRYGVSIKPANDNLVNYYRIDSVSSLEYFHVTQPFDYGDTIGEKASYTSFKSYLYYHYWFDGWDDGFTIPEWRNQGDHYLGIQMNINDTLIYGWIRLNVKIGGNWPKTTIKDYALSKLFDPIEVFNTNKKDISIYPNPVKDILQINLPFAWNHIEVSIFDITGKKQSFRSFKSSELITLNTKSFQSGVYIIFIKNDDNIYKIKMIKK